VIADVVGGGLTFRAACVEVADVKPQADAPLTTTSKLPVSAEVMPVMVSVAVVAPE
jgi:hypothetical protein